MELKTVIPIVIQISLILIVASIGLQSKWSDLIFALRRPALLLRGFVAVYVAVPVVAVALAMALPIEPVVKIGIVAMALSPLAPFAPGKMLKAGAETSFVVGVYIALLVLAVVVVPASLALLASFVPRAGSIGSGAIASFVITSVLVPLAAGLLIASLAPAAAPRLARIASLVGNVAVLIIILPVIFIARNQIGALFGNGGVLAMALTVLAGLAAGHLLGGPDPHRRIALAQAAATRHPGIAGLIVHRNFDDQRAMLAVALFLLVGILVSGLYGKWAHKRLPAVRDPGAAGAVA